MEKGTINAISRKKQTILFIVAIIVTSFNLRPAITSVGPLLGMIRDQVGLANWSAGILTSLPLIAFATASPFAPRIGRKLGNPQTIVLGLILLLLGIMIRSIPLIATLFIGTATAGTGIAIMNVILPVVIKERFPYKVGRMTSIYTTTMGILAAMASGLSVPLAKGMGLGWKVALLLWGVLAVIGIIVWIIAIKENRSTEDAKVEIKVAPPIEGNILKSSLAWQVTIYMGLQSLVFYVVVSWLPEIMQSYGFTATTGGLMVSYAQFIGLPATFLAPILAEKFSNQKGIVLGIGGVLTIGFTGILIGGPLTLMVFWVTLVGIGFGGSISLALTMIGLRSQNAQQAAALSGMAQSGGYFLAGIGPLFIGMLFDLTHTWVVPLIAILAVCVLMTMVGLGAAKNKYVLEE